MQNLKPNDNKFVVPNTFIIGAAKAGTSSLAAMLGQHPEILLSTPKETNFFQTGDYQHGLEWMAKKYFRGYNHEKVILDASPDYMHLKYVTDRIEQSCTNPKFIFILREPISRAYSQYAMFRDFRPGRMPATFIAEINRNLNVFSENRFYCEYERMGNVDIKGGSYDPFIIEQGLYYNDIARYINRFGRENIYICTIEDLIHQTEKLVFELLTFLGIGFYKFIKEKRNIGKAERFELSGPLSSELCRIYVPQVERVGKLIGRNLIEEWEMC